MRVLGNNKFKSLRDFSVQTEMKIDHKKPNLILLKKREKISYVDVTCPFDPPIEKKENAIVRKKRRRQAKKEDTCCTS